MQKKDFLSTKTIFKTLHYLPLNFLYLYGSFFWLKLLRLILDESTTTDSIATIESFQDREIATCHQVNQSSRMIWNLFWDLDYVIVP